MQVDHLVAGRWIRLLQPLVDADGRAFASDGSWRIEEIVADMRSTIVTLRVWSRQGGSTIRLDLRASDGPRLGRMRDWFEVIDPPADAPPEPGHAPPRTLSPLAQALATDDLHSAESRIRSLARQQEYAGENCQTLAEHLETVAREIAPVDRDRATWLYERAIDTWYGWGAMATSGGDGAARAPRIDAARARQAAFLSGMPGSTRP